MYTFLVVSSAEVADDSLIITALTNNEQDVYKRHFYLIPYQFESTELQQGSTDAFKVGFTSTLFQFTAADFDYDRKILYTADIESGQMYKLEPFSWGTKTVDVTILYSGLSHQYMKIAFDWVSNNLYWTDERFAWIMILSLARPDAFKVLIHEHVQRPLGIAVDPKNKYGGMIVCRKMIIRIKLSVK